jgi:hypothetical protein
MTGTDADSPEGFELECLFDDTGNPTEVTIFSPRAEEAATRWMTTDRSVAIPFEETL